MCIYCGEEEASGWDDLCQRCAFAFQVEIAEGMYRLGRYLASWAAFEEWLRARAPAVAGAARA